MSEDLGWDGGGGGSDKSPYVDKGVEALYSEKDKALPEGVLSAKAVLAIFELVKSDYPNPNLSSLVPIIAGRLEGKKFSVEALEEWINLKAQAQLELPHHGGQA